MTIYYQIFINQSLLIQRFTGDWSMKDYSNYIINSRQIVESSNIKLVLTDLRNVNISFDFVDYNSVNKLIEIKKLIPITNFKNVQIVTSPSLTALAHLYQNKMHHSIDNYCYCSTLTYAIKYLELNFSENELETILNKLENSF